jgi:hypothetical protein
VRLSLRAAFLNLVCVGLRCAATSSQAEVYHQYHDDFQSPPYGRSYNRLANLALEEGRIHTTGCPDRV